MKFLRRSLNLEHGWMILRRYFRSTFIASRYNYMINNECIKGVCLLWFQDPTPLICEFHNSLLGISSSTVNHIISLRLTSKDDGWLRACFFIFIFSFIYKFAIFKHTLGTNRIIRILVNVQCTVRSMIDRFRLDGDRSLWAQNWVIIIH